jgi:hypothetical protein
MGKELTLPKGYKLLPGDKLVPLDATDNVPEFYFIGPNKPTDEDVKAAHSDKPSEPILWFNCSENKVYEYSAPHGAWLEVAFTRYVANLNKPAWEIFGKIVNDNSPSSPTKPKVSFSEAMSVIKSRLASRRK